MMRARILVVAMLFAIAFVPAAHAQPVTVFAAASLKNALDELCAQYRQRSGERVVVSYAATSALAKQIENGAPADVFISADSDWMNYIEGKKLVKHGSRVDLLRNAIVLIAPAASNIKLDIVPHFPLARALGNNRLALADPDSVPAGKYGKAALQALGVWPSVADRIARAENVTAALLFVSRGETPLGIVYRTDAVADKRVRIVGIFPKDTHPAIVYPAALLASARNPAADKFYDFLKSAPSLAIFRKYGFMPY